MLDIVIKAVQEASLAVMEVYQENKIDVTYKEIDSSPVTKADEISNTIIRNALACVFSYPILSEESLDDLSRLDASCVWILDPLDGTKEFIAKRDEFTINLALVENGVPIFGVISIPSQNRIYYATQHQGAYLLCDDTHTPIHVGDSHDLNKNIKFAVSRSHRDPWVSHVMKEMQGCEFIPSGSAMKYCAIADGRMDASIRKTPLYEWDIAAADCILTEAGGLITNLSGERFRYNQRNSLITTGIVASSHTLHAPLLSLLKESLRSEHEST